MIRNLAPWSLLLTVLVSLCLPGAAWQSGWGQGPDLPSTDPEEDPWEGFCSGEGVPSGSSWALECRNEGCNHFGEGVECVREMHFTPYGVGESCTCFTDAICCELVFIPNFGFSTAGSCDSEDCRPETRCRLLYEGGRFSAACSN